MSSSAATFLLAGLKRPRNHINAVRSNSVVHTSSLSEQFIVMPSQPNILNRNTRSKSEKTVGTTVHDLDDVVRTFVFLQKFN